MVVEEMGGGSSEVECYRLGLLLTSHVCIVFTCTLCIGGSTIRMSPTLATNSI